MATFSPVDTRLRVLPQAVPSGWATGLQSMANSLSGALMQRRAERMAADAAEAQRTHESALQGDRLTAEREMQQAGIAAQMERLSAGFEHDVDMLNRGFKNRMFEQGRTFDFQREQNTADRGLRRELAGMQDATARRGQDINYDLGTRGLAIDATRAGAQAQRVAAELAAREAAGRGGAMIDPLKAYSAYMGDINTGVPSDPEGFNQQMTSFADFYNRMNVLAGGGAGQRPLRFGPARSGQQEGGAGRLAAPEGADRAQTDTVDIPTGGDDRRWLLGGGIDFSKVTPEGAIRALQHAKTADERRAILEQLPDEVRREVARRIQDR